jgi:hypothetical protein
LKGSVLTVLAVLAVLTALTVLGRGSVMTPL